MYTHKGRHTRLLQLRRNLTLQNKGKKFLMSFLMTSMYRSISQNFYLLFPIPFFFSFFFFFVGTRRLEYHRQMSINTRRFSPNNNIPTS